MEQENSILFHLTSDQVELLCTHFGCSQDNLEEYEICEMLDRYIDEIALN